MVFVQPIDVRFADLDALGHVNHATFLTYLEHARGKWWRPRLGARPFQEEGFVMARVEVDYRNPILLGDQVRVEMHCDHIGTSSFTLACQVIREDGLVMADARTIQVMLDFTTMRPRALGPETRAWLETQR
ncbi:MAG: thioesterase family protein [Holophaga sp.]|nr:thioesterase family protein [Holophaga sp.]